MEKPDLTPAHFVQVCARPHTNELVWLELHLFPGMIPAYFVAMTKWAPLDRIALSYSVAVAVLPETPHLHSQPRPFRTV